MEKRSIVHFEIPATTRLDGAKFFKEAFGWDYENVEEMHYTTFQTGNLRGGFADVNDNMYKPGDVTIHIESHDLAADLKHIEELGGKTVQPPMDIPLSLIHI